MPDELREVRAKLIPEAEMALVALRLRHGWSDVDTVNRALQVYQAIDGYVDDGNILELFDKVTQKTYTITIV
jgi:hypothetical protein